MQTLRLPFWIILLSSWAAVGLAQPPAADSITVLASVEEQLVKVIGSAESSVVALGILKREAAPLRVDGFGLDVLPRTTDEHSPEFLPNEFGSGVIIIAGNSDEPTAERLVLTMYHLVRRPGRRQRSSDRPSIASPLARPTNLRRQNSRRRSSLRFGRAAARSDRHQAQPRGLEAAETGRAFRTPQRSVRDLAGQPVRDRA